MVIMLFRPSPGRPEPPLTAARKCFDAAVFNIQMHRKQISTKSVDLTWIFTQSLFMVLNTLLWTLSFHEIRNEHPKEEVELYLQSAQEGIVLASKQWPGVESAMELYSSFILLCLKAYDFPDETSYSERSVSEESSSASSSWNTSQRLVSTPPTVASSVDPNIYDPSAAQLRTPPLASESSQSQGNGTKLLTRIRETPSGPSNPQLHQPSQESRVSQPPASFDPTSIYNPMPSTMPTLQTWNSTLATQFQALNALPHGSEPYLGAISDSYFRDLNAPLFTDLPVQSLDCEQQRELMANLETASGLYDLGDIRR
ncbi:MAG: hypothetical protein LQ351_002894 [Letrouitia transgressa]|nr:MAG: hypothetical protein LQ351_002894 [Letrouitia transgressa]